jgi:hypothetical protein
MSDILEKKPTKTDLPVELTEELIKIEEQAEKAHIPQKLAQFITPEDLKRNASNYPEMGYELPEALVESVRNRLLELPLVHRTNETRFSSEPTNKISLYDEPVPHSYLVSEDNDVKSRGNTFQLDRDLDLDEFVFLSWGEVFSDFVSGRYALLIRPELLLSPDCIVTPYDIAEIVSSRQLHKGVGKLDDKMRKEIEDEYFSKAVSGSDWLEIQARRIAKMILNGVPEEEAYSTYNGLGEIKYRGRVPRAIVIGTLDLEQKEDYPDYWSYIKQKTGFTIQKPKGRLAKLIGKIF